MLSKANGGMSKPSVAIVLVKFALSKAGDKLSKPSVAVAKAADVLSKPTRTLSKASYAVSKPDLPDVQGCCYAAQRSCSKVRWD